MKENGRHMATFLQVCFIFCFLAALCRCAEFQQTAYRAVTMKQIHEQNDLVFTDSLLVNRNTKSLVACAKLCVEHRESLSFTFAQDTTDATCRCHAVQPSALTQHSPDLGAKCYSLGGVQCNTPPEVVNAQPSPSSGQLGDYVTYRCMTGYQQTGGGAGTRQCDVNGLWSSVTADTDPVCTPVECGSPPAFPSTIASITYGYYGDEVTYSCSHGYKATGGTGKRFCSDSGSWQKMNSDPEPQCTRIECGAPPVIAKMTPSSLTSGHVDDQVTYACAQGYSKAGGGSGARVCSASESWEPVSADSDPVCQAAACPGDDDDCGGD